MNGLEQKQRRRLADELEAGIADLAAAVQERFANVAKSSALQDEVLRAEIDNSVTRLRVDLRETQGELLKEILTVRSRLNAQIDDFQKFTLRSFSERVRWLFRGR